MTIVRYLGRKFGMYPTNEEDITICEIMEQVENCNFTTHCASLLISPINGPSLTINTIINGFQISYILFKLMEESSS